MLQKHTKTIIFASGFEITDRGQIFYVFDSSFIDEHFIEQLALLCKPRGFLIDRLRLYKSIGMIEKRVIVQEFIFP